MAVASFRMLLTTCANPLEDEGTLSLPRVPVRYKQPMLQLAIHGRLHDTFELKVECSDLVFLLVPEPADLTRAIAAAGSGSLSTAQTADSS